MAFQHTVQWHMHQFTCLHQVHSMVYSFTRSSKLLNWKQKKKEITFKCEKSNINVNVVLDFKTFSAVPTSKTRIQIASECTIKRPCYQFFSQHFKLPKHSVNSVKSAPVIVLAIKIVSVVPTSKTSPQQFFSGKEIPKEDPQTPGHFPIQVNFFFHAMPLPHNI